MHDATHAETGNQLVFKSSDDSDPEDPSVPAAVAVAVAVAEENDNEDLNNNNETDPLPFDPQDIPQVPKLNPMSHIEVNPLGPFCKLCKKSFKADQWRRHFTKHHKDVVIAKCVSTAKLLDSLQEEASLKPPGDFSDSDRLFPKHHCHGCSTTFLKPQKFHRHFSRTKNPCSPDSLHCLAGCLKLRCGRFLAVAFPNDSPAAPPTMSALPTVLAPPAVNTPIIAVATETVKRPKPFDFDSYLGALPATYCKNKTLQDCTEYLQPMITDNSCAHGWSKILHKTITDTENFDVHMLQEIAKMKDPTNTVKGSVMLHNFVEAYDYYSKMSAPIIYGSNQGDWRASIVSFNSFENVFGQEDNDKWAFNTRQTNTSPDKEFRYFACYLLASNSAAFEKHAFKFVGNYNLEEIHRKGVIPHMLFDLARERPACDVHSIICKYCIARCFKSSQQQLKLNSVNHSSKVMANIIYIVRLAVCGYVAMLKSNDNNHMCMPAISEIQKSPTLQFLSPWISSIRQMEATKPKTVKNIIHSNGDISCNNALFKLEIWQNLIPLVSKAIINIMEEIFPDELWENFYNVSNKIMVRSACVRFMFAGQKTNIVLLILFLFFFVFQ